MLSTLSSIADKTFIVGYILPLLLFLVVVGFLFIDVPAVHALLQIIATVESFEKLTYLVGGLWVLALLMQLVNQIQLQILEGYRWPVSKVDHLQKAQIASTLLTMLFKSWINSGRWPIRWGSRSRMISRRNGAPYA